MAQEPIGMRLRPARLPAGRQAEIKARRQQYEHYRDKLLSFAERAHA